MDDQGCFVDVYIGWPGRVHDARVFANSSLTKEVKVRCCFQTGRK